jgi:hypothetical protein
MMSRRIRCAIALLALATLLIGAAGMASAQPAADESILIVRPLSFRTVMAQADLPQNNLPDRMYVGGIYEVRFRVMERLSGRFSRRMFEVRLPAANPSYFIQHVPLVILLRDDGNRLSVQSWQRLYQSICLSSRFEALQELHRYGEPFDYSGLHCVLR